MYTVVLKLESWWFNFEPGLFDESVSLGYETSQHVFLYFFFIFFIK